MPSDIFWLNDPNRGRIRVRRGHHELEVNVNALLAMSGSYLEEAVVYEGHSRKRTIRDTPPDVFKYVENLLERERRGDNASFKIMSLGDATGVHDGLNDNIPLIRITIGRTPNKQVLVTCGLHAREWFSQEVVQIFCSLLLRQADHSHLAAPPPPGFERVGLNNVVVDIIPLVNLSGFLCTLSGPGRPVRFVTTPPVTRGGSEIMSVRFTRKTPDVDLNRNFPTYWGRAQGASRDPKAEDYGGPSPASEPETRALMALTSNNNYALVIDCHSFGNEVLAPGGWDPRLTSSSPAHHCQCSVRLARAAPKILFPFLTVQPSQPSFLYHVSGGFEDFVLFETKRPIITVEMGPKSTEFSADSPEAQRHKMSTAINLAHLLVHYFRNINPL